MSVAHKLEQVDDIRWRIPRDAAAGMRVGVMVYATRWMIEQISRDRSLEQAANVATLPGIVGSSLAMPDIHQGYGFPIGGVAATDWQYGVVSPGGVGFDINCGVRLIRADLTENDVRQRIEPLLDQVFRKVPCGVGGSGFVKVKNSDLNAVLEQGSSWMIEHGYGIPRDAEFTEAGGRLPGADAGKVSARAKERGLPQLGTLGSGNHFLEIQFVQEIADQKAAQSLGLAEKQIVILIHSGSRGLGHQVCTDYLREMDSAMKTHGIQLPDRQLACVPSQSKEGQAYLAAMRAAANFAWANRQAMTHFLRSAFDAAFGREVRLDVVYDVCHNIAKQERYEVDGARRDVLVHRKGATRAFPPGHREVTAQYRDVGQPVFIPGSMGTASWVLVGQEGAMKETFGTTCHGAGRLLSRTAAMKGRDLRRVLRDLEEAGIHVRSETKNGILEEVPEAYKDVDEVVDVVHRAGIAKKVARLRPMAVLKG